MFKSTTGNIKCSKVPVQIFYVMYRYKSINVLCAKVQTFWPLRRMLIAQYSTGRLTKCAVCRSMTAHAEISYVSTRSQEEEQIPDMGDIKGSHSTKVGDTPSPPQHLFSHLCFEILSQAKEEVFTVDKLTGNVYGTSSFLN